MVLKVMTIFGTRPEAIKMAPLVKQLERDPEIDAVCCVTAQHREMLDQVLTLFDITPDYDLNIMKHGQTLSDITVRIIKGIEAILIEEKPDIVLVHGDTTTTLSGALAAFYQKIPVGHVEAGLRSYNDFSPYPEEMNRKLTSGIARLHFAATEGNVKNLEAENVPLEAVYKTGNTVIDALMSVIKEDYTFDNEWLNTFDFKDKFVVAMTAHRRENLGKPMVDIFSAVRQVAEKEKNIEVIFPVHLNPKVREVAHSIFDGVENIHLIEPLEYEDFANLQARSAMILTDSGGIQEEAPALGKPVVVLRTETERPEAVEAGTVVIAGVDKDNIVKEFSRLVEDKAHYQKMADAVNPYGDGHACERIVEAIKGYFNA